MKKLIYCSIIVLILACKYGLILFENSIPLTQSDTFIVIGIITVLFYHQELWNHIESIDIFGVKFKKNLEKVLRNQRKYALFNEEGKIFFSTFTDNELNDIKSIGNENWEITFKQKPLYLEIRALTFSASYSVIERDAFIYELRMDSGMDADTSSYPFNIKFILEAYFPV